MADTIKTNLGPVTAYADAKAHGYTGTREEFGALLANAGLNLKAAETAKEGAEVAKQAAETAQKAAAENQKNAETQAANAKASADTAAGQANAAKESATGAANSASAAKKSETNAGQSATAASNAEAAAKQAQQAAETAKTDAEAAKTAAGTSADAAANSAADAKKTLESIPDDYSTLSGKVDENTSGISELKEGKVTKPSFTDDGKIPRAKNGDVEWVEAGQPTDEQTNSAVTSWLNEHPEATTTVQDNSLSPTKLELSFRKKIKRVYRTFQDLLKDTHLEIGTFIETSGFYDVDDGGGGLYLVSNYAPKDNNPCYFPYGNNYIVYIPEKCICNILALGAKKDGTQDISDIVNNFFASKEVTTKRYYTLYIPSGVYLFNKPIKIENGNVYANIIGCSSSRGEYTFFYNDKVYPRYSSSIFLFDLPSDSTSMTVNIAKNGSFNIEGITFASNSATFKSESFTTRPTIPYNIYSIAKNVENVNGLNIESSHMSCVKDCSFIGFSGFGLRSYSHNIFNCFFSDCSIGIVNNKSDLMIYSCYITRCENGIKAESNGVIWASQTFIDQCSHHGILSDKPDQTSLVLNGCIIDHIGYSGICVRNALDANLDIRIGRCGMYYAGKTSDFSSLSEDEKKKATTIYYNNLSRGNIRINVYKRSITDDSTDLTYTLPWVVFGGRYNNTIILGLYDSDYSYFCDEGNVHNTAVYTNKGIATYN